MPPWAATVAPRPALRYPRCVADRSESAAASAELADTLREVEAWLAKNAASPGERAEAQRYLAHLVSAGTDFYLEGDPERPRFVRIVSPTRKLLGDNPDAVYHWTPLRGDRAYRIRGRRGDEAYLSFTVHARAPEGRLGGVFERPVADVNHLGLHVAADGSFEILLAPDPPQGARNAVRLPPDAACVIVRHYWETGEPAAADPTRTFHLAIEPVEAPAPAPPLGDAEWAERLRRLSLFLRSSTLHMPVMPEGGFISRTPNVMGEPTVFRQSGEAAWGAVDIAYSMGPFRVAEDEALVMEGRFPPCLFANVVLWNRFMQTFDYRARPVSRNRATTRLEPDGSFRMVLAHRDPGVPNWLDVEGHREGTVFWRFLMPEAAPERPRCRLVPLASLRG